MALPCFSSSRSDLSNFLESISVIHQSKTFGPNTVRSLQVFHIKTLPVLHRVSASVNTMVPKIQAVLSGKPVTRAWIFGSYSRGEETPQSDVDILVQYDSGCRMSLMDISRIMVELSQALGIKVDLVEDGRLLPFAVESANRDRILVYERAS